MQLNKKNKFKKKKNSEQQIVSTSIQPTLVSIRKFRRKITTAHYNKQQLKKEKKLKKLFRSSMHNSLTKSCYLRRFKFVCNSTFLCFTLTCYIHETSACILINLHVSIINTQNTKKKLKITGSFTVQNCITLTTYDLNPLSTPLNYCC